MQSQKSRSSFTGSTVRSEVRSTGRKSCQLFDVGKFVAKSVHHHYHHHHHHINTIECDLRKEERTEILQTNKQEGLPDPYDSADSLFRSVTNCQLRPCNVPEEGNTQLLQFECLKCLAYGGGGAFDS
jgi:hypothetical protein